MSNKNKGLSTSKNKPKPKRPTHILYFPKYYTFLLSLYHPPPLFFTFLFSISILATFFFFLLLLMANLGDIGVSAVINILGAFAFLLAFALLRIQPINDRVYFPKWYINGGRTSPRNSGYFVGKFVNLNFKTYLTFLNWMPQALRMSESQIIDHAGLDSAVFLRIYLLGYSF